MVEEGGPSDEEVQEEYRRFMGEQAAQTFVPPPLSVRLNQSRQHYAGYLAGLANQRAFVADQLAYWGDGVMTDHPHRARVEGHLRAAEEHLKALYRAIGSVLGALEV